MAFETQEVLEDINDMVHSTLEHLIELWKTIGLNEQSLQSKCNMFRNNIEDILKAMSDEVEETKLCLENNITKLLNMKSILIHDLKLNESGNSYEDVPLIKLETLLKEDVEKFQKLVEDRKKIALKLIEQEKDVCKCLDIIPQGLEISPLPSEQELYEYKMRIDRLDQKKFELLEIFLSKKAVIIEIIKELGIEPSLDFERQVVCESDNSFHVTPTNMKKLDHFYNSLKEKLQQTKSSVAELREKVAELWEQLEESATVQSKFLQKYPGHSLSVMQALQKEVQRCETTKRANIEIFVERIRKEIVEWWDKCRFSLDQRSEFTPFKNNCYTEDLLTLHEIQLTKLKSFYESNKNIFDLIKKREMLWEKMLQLEERANFTDRYKNRGGQLLKEEKERKVISNKLPQVESDLLELIEIYENKHSKQFLIDGENVKDIITRAWENYKQDKHVKLSAKKQAREQLPSCSKIKNIGSISKSRVLTPLAISTSKRKQCTPLVISAKRTRVSNKYTPQVSHNIKIQVNGSTIKRRTSAVRRRLNTSKKRNGSITSNEKTVSSQVSSNLPNYNMFEEYVQKNSHARSTLYNPEPQEGTSLFSTNLPKSEKVKTKHNHFDRVLRTKNMDTPQTTPSRKRLISPRSINSKSKLMAITRTPFLI